MMRKSLDLRGRSFAMVGVAGFETYRALTDKYVGKMRAVVPVGMRNPTLSEVRQFDRALHEEILKWLSRSVGSLDTAIRYHLDDDTLALWRLLDPVLESLPGLERAPTAGPQVKDGGGTKRKADHAEDEAKDPGDSPKALKKCLVCGSKRYPFCPLPADFRKKQREKKKEAKEKAAAKREAAKKAGAPKADK